MSLDCHILVRSRHTYERFVWRYAENQGEAVKEDLIQHLVHIPPKEPTDEMAAASMTRDPRMLKLDPNEWKKQDHYMVLGLEHKRGCPTPEDIRQAYRARVLVYHPDKIAQRNGEGKSKRQKDDAIFKCIQKAYQIISDDDKRAAFDSVDPTFDNSIPSEKLPSDADFYAVYGPVFERNMRFSRQACKLTLGGPETPREEVEEFYRFWSNFDSIRRFDYLDEDESETADNRADKRYLEKKNKAARQKRKNEDNARIRQLFEQAYKADPRVKAFKEADKAAKASRKPGNSKTSTSRPTDAEAAKKKAEEEAKKAEEARNAAAQAEQVAAAKKAKEAEASALRKEKKAFKAIFTQHTYFLPDLTNLKALETEALLVEQICSKLGRLEIEEVRKEVEGKVASGETGEISNILRSRLGMEQVSKPVIASQTKPVPMAASMATAEEIPWGLKETDLLINGTKKFPGGTLNRWETIAEWLNRQLPEDLHKSVDQIIAKANEIKNTSAATCTTPLESTNWDPTTLKRDPRIDQAEPTIAIPATASSAAEPWSAEEQTLLESAIKSTPADDPQRWDRIAEAVGTRSKKECMLRAKELATLLKQQKQ